MVNSSKAFTLIELIFAIVIIAISVISLPTMTDATSSGVAKNVEVQEAIFKAIVMTKSAVGENSFANIDDTEQTTKTLITDDVGLSDYKFKQKYTLDITTSATFNGETNASIKKVTTQIFTEDDELLASFSAYKFNY
ncbi:MAG: prepilin-type N-terminal cleavage/methylation domain-containing protein [Campylobacterota bacterium]|nr:prepilin-type N-terminal cleavage/methylation domain-containing protein [Campylobacterota bacterium]